MLARALRALWAIPGFSANSQSLLHFDERSKAQHSSPSGATLERLSRIWRRVSPRHLGLHLQHSMFPPSLLASQIAKKGINSGTGTHRPMLPKCCCRQPGVGVRRGEAAQGSAPMCRGGPGGGSGPGTRGTAPGARSTAPAAPRKMDAPRPRLTQPGGSGEQRGRAAETPSSPLPL